MIMGRRQGSIAEGQSYNYALHNEIMPRIAEELGINSLPMTRQDYDYDFYRFAVIVARESGLYGADLYDTAGDVMRILLSPTRKGPAPIYGYISRYRKQKDKGVTPQTFDAFWRMGVHQKTRMVLKILSGQKEKRGLSIDYGWGEDEDEGSIGEKFLPESREPIPYEVLRAKEEDPKREKVMAGVPKMLTEQRNGLAYKVIWGLMQKQKDTGKKYTDQDMAGILNFMKIRAPGETPEWTGGAVSRSRYITLELARKYLMEHGMKHGIDWESISASRRGFRFGFSIGR